MLRISEELLSRIRADAESRYPGECCGFIFGSIDGDIKTAVSVLANRNSSAAAEQYHRFTITAEDMMKAQLKAAKNKLDIIGFYHSHPDSPAVPSEYDRSHALPVYSYIIVSCVKGKTSELTNWQLDPDTCYKSFINEESGDM